MLSVDKDRPSPEWIKQLHEQFPCEKEIDRILTRKQQRRGGPGFSPIALETLVAGLEKLLTKHLGDAFKIDDARWLSGGASKLQMAFELEWNRPGVGFEKTAMVLRMEPAESIVETSRLREFQLIKAFEGVVPVPPVFWCDSEGEYLPYPALIYGFAPGVTKPSNASSGVSGLGMSMPADLRVKLIPQFVDHLVRIHNHDFSQADLSAFDVPSIGTTQCAEWGLNWWERVWEEDCDEDAPIMRVAMAWLRRNMPVLDRASVVHSDYRTGNFLFTEHDTKISAWLDWELGRIGDRHQDIAWTTSRAFSSLAEDGKTFLACGLCPIDELLARYQEQSGLTVDPERLRYYRIFNNYQIVVTALASSYRVVRLGKTHQDVLIAWIEAAAYGPAEELRRELQELM